MNLWDETSRINESLCNTVKNSEYVSTSLRDVPFLFYLVNSLEWKFIKRMVEFSGNIFYSNDNEPFSALSTKRSHVLKQAAGLFKYVCPFTGHHSLQG